MPRAITYRYPWRAMVADHVRALLGLACTGTPLALMELPGLVQGVLAFLTIIFVLFGLQAALRHATRVLVSERDGSPLSAMIGRPETSENRRVDGHGPGRRSGCLGEAKHVGCLCLEEGRRGQLIAVDGHVISSKSVEHDEHDVLWRKRRGGNVADGIPP